MCGAHNVEHIVSGTQCSAHRVVDIKLSNIRNIMSSQHPICCQHRLQTIRVSLDCQCCHHPVITQCVFYLHSCCSNTVTYICVYSEPADCGHTFCEAVFHRLTTGSRPVTSAVDSSTKQTSTDTKTYRAGVRAIKRGRTGPWVPGVTFRFASLVVVWYTAIWSLDRRHS